MTLGELIKAGSTLRGVCAGCERVKPIDPAKIRLPAETTLDAIEQKLRCQECDAHSVRLSVVPRPATDDVMQDPAVKALAEAFPGAPMTITTSKDQL
jgi:hypothetical protein